MAFIRGCNFLPVIDRQQMLKATPAKKGSNVSEQLTEEQRAQTESFVAYGACGHLVACAVDRPEYAKDNAKEVAKWIRDGLRIGKLTVAEVRAADWCKCKRTKKVGM